jgi:hypothetical protein
LKTAASMDDIEIDSSLNCVANPVMRLLRGMMYVPLINRLARVGTDLLAASIKLCADTQITLMDQVKEHGCSEPKL